MSAWTPSLGAWPVAGGVRFRVWAPTRKRVEIVIEAPGAPRREPLLAGTDGCHTIDLSGLAAGALYRYLLDGEGPFPDPASRFQPQGVHGPSEVVDPAGFAWSDAGWRGLTLDRLTVYELHVGCFSAAGRFAGVTERLAELAELGVTAIELMPLADFAGDRNWGYDGVAPFAPARCYGRPDELRRLVDAAHGAGLGVILDVVYNHFGPDGAYQGAFSPFYFTQQSRTPWGDAINLHGAHATEVRRYLRENALHWIHEYHVDGLRLDATHALHDEGEPKFLAELAEACARARPDRPPLLIAEDHRNLPALVLPRERGGRGLSAVWADDFHHQLRRHVAGDSEGYYRDFSGSAADLARTVRQGWFFTGQHSLHLDGPRGSDPAGLAPRRFVVCLQNHDQVGNRALGERLHHQLEPAVFRAATALLLCLPETPLLFMGQEFAASAPFLYFTDHNPELGRLVTEGRRREFASFKAFADESVRERIPDPQALETFRRSTLDWSEREREPHASQLRLTKALLALRRDGLPLARPDWEGFAARESGEEGVALVRRDGPRASVALVRLRGAGPVAAPPGPLAGLPEAAAWRVLLSTEDPRFSVDPRPPRLESGPGVPRARFERPGALILEADGPPSGRVQAR